MNGVMMMFRKTLSSNNQIDKNGAGTLFHNVIDFQMEDLVIGNSIISVGTGPYERNLFIQKNYRYESLQDACLFSINRLPSSHACKSGVYQTITDTNYSYSHALSEVIPYLANISFINTQLWSCDQFVGANKLAINCL